MIRFSDISNKNTLNIFCDASTTRDGKITGYGFIAIVNEAVIYQDTRVSYGTNNLGEMAALNLAVHYASHQMHNFPIINIFSDSQISLFAIRDWIFKWRLRNERNNIMYDYFTGSNTKVANQFLLNDIVATIMNTGLRCTFLHQKGHVQIANRKSLENAKRVFKNSNKISDGVDMELVMYISMYNNMIDSLSRRAIYEVENICNHPVYFHANEELNKKQYWNQIHSNNIFNSGEINYEEENISKSN